MNLYCEPVQGLNWRSFCWALSGVRPCAGGGRAGRAGAVF